MPPRPRNTAPSLEALQQELAALKARQALLRVEMRKLRVGSTGVTKLEEKLAKQLASAKWTVHLIRQNNPEWDELGFYQSVQGKPPTPRGPRRRAKAE